MTTFSASLKAFARKVDRRNRQIFLQTAAEVDRSIRVGSELTGAPGQPVDTGFLRTSWELSFPSRVQAVISTSTVYAIFQEEGGNSRGAFQLRSKVGGFGSVKLTRAGWGRIVEFVTNDVVRNDA